MISTGALFFTEEVDLRDEDGMYMRQALFNRTTHRNLPVIYIGNRCFTYQELEHCHKHTPTELENMLRDAGAITGWSKDRAMVEATGKGTAEMYTRIAKTY